MSEPPPERPKREINGWSIAVGALVGAAVAASVCAALWGEPSHLKRTYRNETLAGICVIAAVAIWRRHDLSGSLKWRAIGFAAGAPVAFGLVWVLGGPKPPPRLRTEQLPGFSISVLDDKVEHINDNYAFGSLESRGRHGARVWVLWWAGSLFPEGELLEETKYILHEGFRWKLFPVEGEHSYAAGDLPVQSLELLAGGNRYQMSIVQCGERILMPITGGNSYDGKVDLPALHRRVVASVVCAPDPVEERLVGKPPPVLLDLPPGWLREDSARDGTQALFRGPEVGTIIAYTLLDGLDAEGVAGGVTYSVDDMEGEEVWTTSMAPTDAIGGLDSWAGMLTDDGEAYEVLAVTAPCLGHEMVVIYVGEPDFAPARAALTSARCE